MARSRALYRDDRLVSARAHVALDAAEMMVALPGCAPRRISLDGASAQIVDAEHRRRFVRMLTIDRGSDRTALITPPERGAIAPRIVPMPRAPDDAAIVDERVWDVVAEWVMRGGRLAGLTVAELASLAAIATPHFAVVLGEIAAAAALELVWEEVGPLRGGVDVDASLQPLYEAARASVRASEALVAALAVCAVRRARRRAG
ncbi:MAG TPA: hypothetical protein VL463_11625 [Kofleriaceae bacterium]|nr:hypothetical protein [Kofleriaceae bacterium]